MGLGRAGRRHGGESRGRGRMEVVFKRTCRCEAHACGCGAIREMNGAQCCVINAATLAVHHLALPFSLGQWPSFPPSPALASLWPYLSHLCSLSPSIPPCLSFLLSLCPFPLSLKGTMYTTWPSHWPHSHLTFQTHSPICPYMSRTMHHTESC